MSERFKVSSVGEKGRNYGSTEAEYDGKNTSDSLSVEGSPKSADSQEREGGGEGASSEPMPGASTNTGDNTTNCSINQSMQPGNGLISSIYQHILCAYASLIKENLGFKEFI